MPHSNMPPMDQDAERDLRRWERMLKPEDEPYTMAELQALAEDIVRYCPSLSHLLLALGGKKDSEFSKLN